MSESEMMGLIDAELMVDVPDSLDAKLDAMLDIERADTQPPPPDPMQSVRPYRGELSESCHDSNRQLRGMRRVGAF